VGVAVSGYRGFYLTQESFTLNVTEKQFHFSENVSMISGELFKITSGRYVAS
jgi:hypothetical protein